MKSLYVLIVEFGFLSVLIGIISHLSWTKMTLGAVLSIIGAFFPTNDHGVETGTGRAHFKLFGNEFSINGAVRFFVSAGGVILIIGSLFEGAQTYSETKADHIELRQTHSK